MMSFDQLSVTNPLLLALVVPKRGRDSKRKGCNKNDRCNQKWSL